MTSGPAIVLREEHEVTKEIVHVLKGMAGALHDGHAVQPEHLRRALEALACCVDCCRNEKEERVLFPALLRAKPREAKPLLDHLRAQHEEGRRLLHAMAEHADGAGEGKARDVAAFEDAATRYARLVKDHITEEDTALLPLMERAFGRETKRAVAIAFEDLERRAAAMPPERMRASLAELSSLYARYAAAA